MGERTRVPRGVNSSGFLTTILIQLVLIHKEHVFSPFLTVYASESSGPSCAVIVAWHSLQLVAASFSGS